ncbi:MAG: DNA primase [Clostridia bacterium]|nr:DNA primase [Clostridia bacterium]
MARRISDDLISEICNQNDIVDYVSQYVALKKSGRDYSGLCPFHNEKTPSFHVSRDKQLFHCFGCGASGNLVQFVMRAENLDFVDSIKVLADRVGIIIPDEEDFNNENHEKKKKVLEMNRLSARFFHNCLCDKELGMNAQRYFLSRKISSKTITTYGLGYAPKSKDTLLNYLKGKGYLEHEIVEGGLAVMREGRAIDKFRDRVMFPIINVRGDVIGFGGRIMHNNKEINGYKIPKYLNSSETVVFDKGKNLFSLNIAKNEQKSEIILCEGYMDVISTYQAGVKNIVATLGTAITPDQAKLMMRYANEILICYDSDEAGIKATLRAIDIINEVGGKSRVIKLKGAKDPDEYINKNGVERFREAVKKSVPSTEFRISLIKSAYDTSTTDGKVKFLDEVVDVFKTVHDPIEIDAYITKISRDMDVNKDAVLSKYKEKSAKDKYKNQIRARNNIEQKRIEKVQVNGVSQKVPPALLGAQKRLLSLIVSNKRFYNIAKKEITPDEFSKDIFRRLATKIYQSYQNGENPQEAIILNDFCANDEEMNEASSVFYNMEVYTGDTQVIYDLIYTIKIGKIQTQIDSETDAKRLMELFNEKKQLEDKKNKWEEQ